MEPRLLPAQAAHAPLAPQACTSRPALQTPFAQQPPWHSVPALQLVPHRCVVASQALPRGQSSAEVQPQWPSTQASPALAPVQRAQVPELPQVAACDPAVHRPAAQQPPLQSLKPPSAPQVVLHAWLERSHAVPVAQSAVLAHPASAPASVVPASAVPASAMPASRPASVTPASKAVPASASGVPASWRAWKSRSAELKSQAHNSRHRPNATRFKAAPPAPRRTGRGHWAEGPRRRAGAPTRRHARGARPGAQRRPPPR